MDIQLARTFLMVAETGSFIDAGRKMNVTQSTVSARIKSLEQMFGRPLFARSKSGATLTPAGDQVQKHALAMVRVWQHAQFEVGLTGPYRDHLAVGAHATLWDGFLLKWISWLRGNVPDEALEEKYGAQGEKMQPSTGFVLPYPNISRGRLMAFPRRFWISKNNHNEKRKRGTLLPCAFLPLCDPESISEQLILNTVLREGAQLNV
jgi:hypothetical protein